MAFGFDTGHPIDERAQRRAAFAQANLRRVNESMRRVDDTPLAFRCECGQLGCNALILLSRDEYAAIRAHPRRFAVVPGHEVAEIEHEVERHHGHAVVETHAPAAIEVADATSPL
jgi:hypothetical protein